jgi:hypothetical protein
MDSKVFNLETAVGNPYMVQHIGLSGVFKKIELTLLAMRLFSNTPGESIGCARYVLLTA